MMKKYKILLIIAAANSWLFNIHATDSNNKDAANDPADVVALKSAISVAGTYIGEGIGYFVINTLAEKLYASSSDSGIIATGISDANVYTFVNNWGWFGKKIGAISGVALFNQFGDRYIEIYRIMRSKNLQSAFNDWFNSWRNLPQCNWQDIKNCTIDVLFAYLLFDLRTKK